MALTSFDGGFSSKQQRLARVGEAAAENIKVSKEQWARLQDTPFAQRQRLCESSSEEKTRARDELRAQRDAEFQPSDEDWGAPKAFAYDECVDYYTALGLDEYASLHEIKQAYRKLCLVYHPDKTGSLDEEKRQEYGLIFIEIRNAYKTLSDPATRRQYDRDRDHDLAALEVHGTKIKTKASFDATALLRRLISRSAPDDADRVLEIPIKCRLEKFFWGGCKLAKRFHTRTGSAYEVPYLLPVPSGALEGHAFSFKSSRESQDDAAVDRIAFVLTSKPHGDVERRDGDLVAKQAVRLEADLFAQPAIGLQVAGVRGQHVALWGRNPFYLASGGSGAELSVRIHGEGLPPDGALRFVAKLGVGGGAGGGGGVGPGGGAESSDAGGDISAHDDIVVRLSHLMTKAKMAVRIGKDATIADVRAKARQTLGFAASDRVLVLAETATGFTPYPDDMPLGDVRTLGLGGKQWKEVPLGRERAQRLLQILAGLCEAEAFGASLAKAYGADEAEAEVVRLWEGICEVLPDFGFDPSIESLQDVLARGLAELEGESSLELLRTRCQKLVVGFNPEEYKKLQENTGGDPAAGSTGPQQPQRRAGKPLVCELELGPLSGEIRLLTQPECSLRFYSNLRQPAVAPPGRFRPLPVFAVALHCRAAASSRGAAAWDRFKVELLPLVQETALLLSSYFRRLLPRPLAQVPASFEACAETSSKEDAARLAAMWLRNGERSAREGAHFLAASARAAALGALREAGASPEAEAAALADRAESLLELGHWEATRGDALAATELQPASARAWRLLGRAATRLGAERTGEAREAHLKALRLEPTLQNADWLQRAAEAACSSRDAGEAHADKGRGNSAMEARDFAGAVAWYTTALAKLPERQEAVDDPHALLRAMLHANRSSAFSRLGQWEAAFADGRLAVAAAPDFPKAHGCLGTASLGCRRHEEAYVAFSRALSLAPTERLFFRGWQAAAALLPLWSSVDGRARARRRFGLDSARPSGSAKVFAVSDVRFDGRASEEWVSKLDKSKFQDHILIVAGNLGGTLSSIARALGVLRLRFRRVFFTPGNSDLALHGAEAGAFPDSLAKLFALLRVCDELGVDVGPAPVCSDVFVVPLFSWYNAWFDKFDPFPDPSRKTHQGCKWGRLDPDLQVWKFFLSLNRPHLALPYHGKVITFSHFLPRQDLPYDPSRPQASLKAMGCEELDEQLRRVRSQLHFYGHAGKSHGKRVDGVSYVQHALRLDVKSRFEHTPIVCVFDGETLCNEPCSITASE